MKRLLILLLLLFIIPQAAFAAIVGLVLHLEGDVYRQGNQKLLPGIVQTVDSKDAIETKKNSRLVLSFRDGSQLILFENSSIQLELNQPYTPFNRIRLQQGDCWLLIPQTDRAYRIQLADLTVESQNVAIRFTLNAADHNGSVSIDSGSATILDSQTNRSYPAGSQIAVLDGKINQVAYDGVRILLSSNLTHYNLTRSGQLPVLIRAALPPGYSVRKPVPAFVIVASPNLAVKYPAISFYQEEIEIEVTALGSGVSELFVVSERFEDKPALAGMIPISVSPMTNFKNVKIKTSRGNITIKLAPVQN
jgi:hypothetical protein